MKRLGVWMLVAAMTLIFSGIGMAVDSSTLTVSANVVGTCKFSSGASTLGFGALDPSVGSDVSGSGTTQFWCTKGVSETIGAGNGANFSGGSRNMKDTVSSDVIPYSLTLSPDANPNNGPGSPRTLSINGGVLGTDYTGKTAGNYSDTVTLTINP